MMCCARSSRMLSGFPISSCLKRQMFIYGIYYRRKQRNGQQRQKPILFTELFKLCVPYLSYMKRFFYIAGLVACILLLVGCNDTGTSAAETADTTAPAEVSSLTATAGDQKVKLTWTNPNDSDFAGVQIITTATTANTVVSTKTTKASVYTVTGLTNATEYTFTLTTFDSDANYSDGVETTATPASSDGTGTTGTTTTTTTTDSTAATWAYTASAPVSPVSSSTATLTISGLTSGTSKVYLVKLNSGSTTISASSTGYVTASSGITASSSTTASASRTAASSAASSLAAQQFAHFVLPEKLNPHDIAQDLTGSRSIAKAGGSSASGATASRSLASASASATTAANTAYEIGDTKSIYVDQDSDISTFAAETATLRAKGEHCYVWVVDDYYASSASGDKVDSTIASKYATLFDTIYPMETNVFGNESDELLSYSSSAISEVDMSSYDTGTMVNIVIYDIANDYSASSGSTSGIVGYFYCKDYYTSDSTVKGSYSIINYSNKGKYFYVDSYYANAYLEVTYSTLAHEFQHMINFGMKDMTYDVSPSTWYNEMLSMLCEDMMQSELDIDDDDSPKGRLPTFNQYYYATGVAEYRDDSTSYALVSYATAYAFGAWLCRWYGGASLVNRFMNNNAVDQESIADAVSEVTGTTMTFDEILEAYCKSLVFQDTTLGQPTFNQAASSGTYYSAITYSSTGYTYPMTAINLWDTAYEWTSSSSSTSNPGGSGSGGMTAIRPTGF